jgi:uncharacterized protein
MGRTEQKNFIAALETEVQSRFNGETTGHDWHHIDRVRKTALKLAAAEDADLYIVEAAALLHDIADHNFYDNYLEIGPLHAESLVLKFGESQELASKVAAIVAEVSFKGAGVETPVSSIESAVVQDADRIDALGAVGIARAFTFGGSRGQPLHIPGEKATQHSSFSEYASDKGSTINHFYEKLLLLKDRMQTESGRKLAKKRHETMEVFLQEFFDEWGA